MQCVATMLGRCHKAVWASFMCATCRKQAPAKRRTLELKQRFSSPSKGKKWGRRPSRGTVPYGPNVGANVVTRKICLFSRISPCAFRKVLMTERLGKQVAHVIPLDRASCPGPTRATRLGLWTFRPPCDIAASNEAQGQMRNIHTNIRH